MVALPPSKMIAAIEEAFNEAGASAILISNKTKNPRCFSVTAGDNFSVWIYIWTLTHGGGAARPVDEYRIQLTSVTSPLKQNPDGSTILLGYEPNIKCFAGFDIRKHQRFSNRSPSIQININTLREAQRDGFAFLRKGNDEIAVGFRPDNILSYSQNADSFHQGGSDTKTSNLLSKIARFDKVTKTETEALPKERQRIVTKISRLVRSGDFRHKVTVAYDRRCAVTGLQLRLIEAAHILPVGAQGSIDEVKNGMSYHLPITLPMIGGLYI